MRRELPVAQGVARYIFMGIAVLAAVVACAPESPMSVPDLTVVRSDVRTDRAERDPWVQVSAGGAVACGIRKLGAFYCWGQNGGSSPGGLGNGTLGGLSSSPTRVVGPARWKAVSTGYSGTCAITETGDGYCWRDNRSGELGIGADAASLPFTGMPMKIAGNLRWDAIQFGEYHVCGLTRSRDVWCWGNNERGQLGDGTFANRNAPVQVAAGTRFTEIRVNATGTCAVRLRGKSLCWGQYDAIHTSAVPVEVAEAGELTNVTPVSRLTLCGLDQARRGYCWGWNSSFGTLGTGPISSPFLQYPTPLVSDRRWKGFAEGVAEHVCAISLTGQGYCWGDNNSGELGDGSDVNRDTPVRIGLNLHWKQLATGLGEYGMPGKNSTCGLTVDGDIYCWGANYTGQLGDGTLVDRTSPVLVNRP